MAKLNKVESNKESVIFSDLTFNLQENSLSIKPTNRYSICIILLHILITLRNHFFMAKHCG